MVLCYNKEIFISGFVTAYLLFVMIAFFEDTINGWFEKIYKILGFE